MSFFSAIVLAANTESRNPTPEKARILFGQLGLVRPDAPEYGVEHGLDNLAEDVTALFDDRTALDQNKHFFTPDGISFREGVEIEGPDCAFTGKGWSVRIHGNGYLYPWSFDDLRARVISTPKLVQLQMAMGEAFGGHFRWPFRKRALRKRLIDGESGWVWFMSESL